MSHHLAHERLKRALEQSAEAAGCTIDVLYEAAGDAGLAMFAGSDHHLDLVVRGDANCAWIDTLDEHALYLPGFVVIELFAFDVEPVEDAMQAQVKASIVKEA